MISSFSVRFTSRILGLNKSGSQKANYIWNTAAGLVNAGKSIIILMFISHILTKESAGIFSYAIAYGNLMLTVGKFGMRNYQVTDMLQYVRFKEYMMSRVVTVAAMLGVSAIYNAYYAFIGMYSFEKCFVIMGMCVLFAVDAFEDVFAGEFQRNKRLDVGARSYCLRWCGIIGIFIVSIIFIKSLIWACAMAVLFSISSCWLFLYQSRGLVNLDDDSSRKSVRGMVILLRDCLPLCVSGFFTYYICNAAKYVIDKKMTDLEQAYFGYISMPVFAIGLLSTIIYQPMLVELAQLWENNGKRFFKKIARQLFLILLITIFSLIFAYFIGIPVLNILYNVELASYKIDLLILISGGCMQAMTGFLTVIFVIIRSQKILLAIYTVNALSAYILAELMVGFLGVRGASVGYWLTMLIICICLFVGVLLLVKTKKEL